MTTQTVTQPARIEAGQLATQIVFGLWPDDADLKPSWARRHPDDRPLKKDRLAPVTETSQVQVDDLVLIYDEPGGVAFDLLGMRTAREAVSAVAGYRTSDKVAVARVTGKTARTITVVDCFAPTGFWKSCVITRFGTPRTNAAPRTLRLNTGGRQIGYLGSVSELRGRIVRDAQYDAWRAAYKRAQEEEAASEAARRRVQEERQERERPQREAARALNEIAGEELVGWREPFGGPKANEWLSTPGRLRTYLAGLNAVGTIADDAFAEVLAQVEVLGF
ncbi:hypothetical protein [Streptomyces californicus]|uniref:hypothetical protein n=1 Tax=Streptomyces californicus TaxID=67351 RepID=UPI00296E2DDD|nr:hypothetical protein [Streptomyces californicus]MDW4912495.1 hypothetical protein [Streptomyces californicus]